MKYRMRLTELEEEKYLDVESKTIKYYEQCGKFIDRARVMLDVFK